MLKSIQIFTILVVILAIGTISMAEAHPHATIELMDSHSHIFADERFHDNFLIHTFDQVIISITDFFNSVF